ncbi:MAG: exo-beta-N-acetylmuramidase NamZ family protein [Kiritimatiellia bacterium]
MSGLDRLLENPLPFPGAKAGFLGHHASLTRQGRHAVECLLEKAEWEITRLFSPEHGFFGAAAAGELVGNLRHPEWDLPLFSLYGEHRSPPPAWLQGLDLMVVDLQDLGVRCYTYASTLLLMMRACAQAGVSMIVLDRPTPLAGIIDGPDLDASLESFVGMIPLPLVFGLSQGALAEFLHKTDSECRKLNLQVFRDSEAPGLEARWVPPSPAIVSVQSARLYPVTVWCEAVPGVRVDRGGPHSFSEWLMPDFPDALFSNPPRFSGMQAESFSRHIDGRLWSGWRFSIPDLSAFRPVENAVRLLCALRDHLGAERLFDTEGARPEFFDRLIGTATVRKQIQRGAETAEICRDWQWQNAQ